MRQLTEFLGWPHELVLLGVRHPRDARMSALFWAYVAGDPIPPCDEARWLERVWLGAIKAVLAPLAALKAQAAYRRHARRQRATLRIQRAALTFLWRPGGWAEGASRALFA